MTTEAYFTKFDIFAQQAGYDAVDFDTMKIRTVNRSLNKSLVANIHDTTTLPTTWDMYKTRATQLDNNWRISRVSILLHPHRKSREATTLSVLSSLTAAQDVKAATTSSAVTRIEGDWQALFRAGACVYCKTPGHMKAQCPILTAKNAVNVAPCPFSPQFRPSARQIVTENMDLPSYVPLSAASSSPPASVVFDDRSSQVSSGFVAGRE